MIRISFYRPALRLAAAWIGITVLAGLNLPAKADAFSDIVRKTEALTPEQEQKSFHLPPGFEIQLVAAEPEIGKPINMAFDDAGRLWVSLSREYPFPAPTNRAARDVIKVLSDFQADGRAASIKVFAANLNIPIGVYPYRDGALAYSIPYIYFFHDTNGDGRADAREIFLGRFGFEKDTHGMTSSFRRGFDGWLYANHGFNNDSVLTAKDGSSIRMNSGNTYRVKIDGSHIEQFTWGRVNPFGLVFDPLGNIFSADCETFPIYQILRGGYYPSFGKPDDGLGFAPPMMHHRHGSTAIAGTVYYAATNFPPPFQDNIFVGNVMTCRIDRDSMEKHGATLIAHEEQDFLSTDDPWFRPVDLQMGPDGALYVADFYNRIIGHYEVPLDHPGRDRERGRIWRIVYRGQEGNIRNPLPQSVDVSHDSATELIGRLGDANLTLRMLAMNELTDRIGRAAVEPVSKMMRDAQSTVFQKIHGLWVLYRFGALDEGTLAAAAHDSDSRLRVHAMRVYSELKTLTPRQHEIVLAGLGDSDALVERCAADALGCHADFENIRPLLNARQRVASDDTHLLYVIRMALRNQLLAPENFARLPLAPWSEADQNSIADVCPGVHSGASAQFLVEHLQNHAEDRETAANYLRYACRYLPESGLAPLVAVVRKKFAGDVAFELALFKSVREGLAQRGNSLPADARAWGAALAEELFAPQDERNVAWHNEPIPGKDPTNPWSLENRTASDGQTGLYISSFPAGEPLTGILRSRPFVLPARLQFYLAGHDGYPGQALHGENFVRLRDAASREILRRTPPPRNDTAQLIVWDLKDQAGKSGYLEIIDDNTDRAYAWLAASRFDPAVAPVPPVAPNELDHLQQAGAELAGSLHLAKFDPALVALLENKEVGTETRVAAVRALVEINPIAHLAELRRILDADQPPKLIEATIRSLGGIDSPEARGMLTNALSTAAQRVQTQAALALAGSAEGAEQLLGAVADGKASARLLQDRALQDRLNASKPARLAERLEQLTKGLPPADEQRQKLIDARVAGYDSAHASAARGVEVFRKNCSVCHAFNGQGAVIGPALEGAGNRGVPRLVEDILDPSHNVDVAFRVTLFTLKDGDVQSGLVRRDEGEMVVIAGSNGKESSIAKKEIAARSQSKLSLMPDNFSQVLAPNDLNDLLAYLTAKPADK
jgi:putative heme-binding domain-containing protein